MIRDLSLVLFVLCSAAAGAQTAGQRAAWDALMLSPFGALPLQALSSAQPERPRGEVQVRYGRWKYDNDDVAHNTFGLGLAAELPARSTLTLTGAYLMVQCGNCSGWKIGGVELESTLWRQTFSVSSRRPVTAGIGVQGFASVARHAANEHDRASSVALAIPIGLGFALFRRSYVDLSAVPGIGAGRIAGIDRADGGNRPSLGAAGAWRFPSGFGVELGVQKIFIDGGPSQLGVGLMWRLGSSGSPGP